jgi:hypothetical protein
VIIDLRNINSFKGLVVGNFEGIILEVTRTDLREHNDGADNQEDEISSVQSVTLYIPK